MTKDQLAEDPLIVDQLTEFKYWAKSFMEELKSYAETALPALTTSLLTITRFRL